MSQTVLLVNGDDDARTIFGRVLDYYGYDVLAAPDFPTARALLRERARRGQPVGLVIGELVVSGGGGGALPHLLRADESLGSPRVLVVTTHPGDTTPAAASMAGVDGVLRKPVELMHLLAEVRRIVGPAVQPRGLRSALGSDAELR